MERKMGPIKNSLTKTGATQDLEELATENVARSILAAWKSLPLMEESA